MTVWMYVARLRVLMEQNTIGSFLEDVSGMVSVVGAGQPPPI